jgi:hypothetical protein
MGPTSVNQMVPVIEDNSCAMWCLAFYLGVSLPDVMRAVTLVDRNMGKTGLHTNTIKRVAKVLGADLRFRRFTDDASVYGILRLHDHAVVVRNGLIFDPEHATVWETRDYLRRRKKRVEGVFVAVE